ncbi:MAG: hypothetical protein JF589_15190 [Gemmatimonadetes bacterium]|jgi:hypothetical protein|nr:hypothetical protein [Gemmatimonadota bacterium]
MRRDRDDDRRATADAAAEWAKGMEHDDDVEAAIDFLARRAAQTAVHPAPAPDGSTVDLTRYRAQRMRERLLRTLGNVLAAIERRDLDRVLALLDEPEAYRCIPPRVREEAILIAQRPDGSLRAPIRLYRFQYLLYRLSDEPLESPLDPGQFALEFAPASPPTSLRATQGVRELSFSQRPLLERRAVRNRRRRGRGRRTFVR